MHWVRWNTICMPLSGGGMGFADLNLTNRALLGKWVWKFANDKNSLWKNFLCSKHDVSCHSMDISKVLSPKDSWIWRGIVNNFIKDDAIGGCLRSHAKLQIGNGKSISFWSDLWIGEFPLKLLFPRIFALSTNKLGTVVDFGSFDSNGWGWNIQTRRSLCDWEIEQLAELLDMLKNINLLEHLEDCLLWDGSGEGLFSVKACRRVLSSSLDDSFQWNKCVWQGLVPPRVETFLWQLSHQKVAVRVELLKRGVHLGDNTLCPFCNQRDESVQHLFISCVVSWDLWTKLLGYWGIQLAIPQDPPSLLCSWAALMPNSAIWKFIPGAVFWLAKWFLAKYPLVSIQVDSLIGDPSLADHFSAPKVLNSIVYCWNPPLVDYFKMNVDGAVCCVGMMADWVLKGKLIIECDSKTAVDWIINQVSAPVFLSNFVKEIVASVSLIHAIVRWIPRSCNCEADKLAKEGIGIGQETLTEENLADEDIENELAPIAVQLAYVHQEAVGAYTDIINRNMADEPSLAVALNNLIAVKGPKDVSDSLRKLDRLKEKDSQKFELAHAIDLKLSPKQKETLYVNRVLLLLHANKMDQARELVSVLPEMFPDSVMPVLLQAAVLVRENKAGKAEEMLDQFAETFPEKSKIILLARAQVATAAGHPQIAAESLVKVPDIQHMPATVATLVILKERAGDINGAATVFDSAIKWWKSAMTEDNKLSVIMREAASFKLRHGKEEEAAHLYEELVKGHGDIEALVGLVTTVARVNIEKAEAYEKQLKPLPGLKGVDVDALEKTSGAKPVDGASRGGIADAQEDGKTKEKPKKKRKRKPRYPKGFDPANPGPPPDPERWLPKRERSSYRPKRKDKRAAQVRGSQGAVVRDKSESSASATNSSTSNPKSHQSTSSKGASQNAEPARPQSKSSRKKSRK
ncbi:hypothetical protein F3Y22_tig00110206pilonHSYRG00009 [Hibiscus syriacus]|uniref:Signal recognition particle subunit SRP72 n=1 Tax=Hibiscus syriacus TaxID=106335 RepID=A0A6A3BBQ2_HIBSY|nr:hypothetical protein F3Y22_tig00110206pilonHSYRG00009 [Hibiscus syriacus]